MTSTPLLDSIHSPADLRRLEEKQLPALAQELREELIDVVSRTGGHLGAGLGVVELTLALHYIFNTPDDKLIWDVGHQAYPHKMLTGRRERMETIRQPGGLSGFCKPDESPYDTFGAGHSSTSISAALGMAAARDLKGARNEVIAVIGDGAMSAGMAYEALNNAAALDTRMTVILNDNDMSIAPAVGAMSHHLSQLTTSSTYRNFRDFGRNIVDHLPERLRDAAKSAERYARNVGVGGGSVFEELGMYYIGPIDGHDLTTLLPILRHIRDDSHNDPILLHVVTQKGKGFSPAESNHERYHGVSKFDRASGKQHKASGGAPSYTSVFADTLIDCAAENEKIVAITAAMPSGTGLNKFADAFPQRAYDVGIAEQHAVTFAAGLAMEGMRPFVAIYSTFLQRAYDQIVHDVAIQNLPVCFAIDRAGLVGADGPTHAGLFDIAFLATLPNMVVMAAGDEAELARMVHTTALHDSSPTAIRYPRGNGLGVVMEETAPLEIGKGRLIHEALDARVALLNFGGRLGACMDAQRQLQTQHITVTLADARFAKPLDTELIDRLLEQHDFVLTIEEGVHGGFDAQVMHYVQTTNPSRLSQLRSLALPDHFQPHGTPDALYHEAGLSADAISQTVQQLLKH